MAQLPQRSVFSPLSMIDRDLDDVFEGFFRPMRGSNATTGALAPPMDVTEHDDAYVLHAELPGFSKDDIQVRLDGGLLTIEAESMQSSNGDEAPAGKPVIRERRYGKYRRTLNLGDEVEPEAIKASYNDGVLEITLPKKAPRTPASQRIAVD